MPMITAFLQPLADRIQRVSTQCAVPVQVTAAYTRADCVYVYTTQPYDLTQDRWLRLAAAITADLAPARCLAARYGRELQFAIFPPPDDALDAGSAAAQLSTGDACVTPTEQIEPWGGEQPEVRATHASPQPQQAIVDVLRPWWKIHRSEPGCITKAIRHVYGEHTPAGGMFYNRIKAAIAILDAEI